MSYFAKRHHDETRRRRAEAMHSQHETMRHHDEMKQEREKEKRRIDQRIVQLDGPQRATR
jgi:hypothetical protein